MKYNIYLTQSIETLMNKELIATANSFKEARVNIVQYLDSHNLGNNNYWRYLLAEDATYIDFGSWSKFIAIVPPITVEDMMQED